MGGRDVSPVEVAGRPPRNRLDWVARRVSDVFSPPVLSGGLAVILSGHGAASLGSTLTWGGTYVALADLVPVAYIIQRLRRGLVSDLHLRIRAERTRPVLVTVACVGLVTALSLALGAPRPFQAFMALTLFQAVVLALVTLHWQISYHSAAAAGLVTATLILWGSSALALAPVLPLVGWARMRLRRHTLGQVVAGAAVSVVLFGPMLAYSLR
jgi:hypothetical protein